jgi:hypothetical protein
MRKFIILSVMASLVALTLFLGQAGQAAKNGSTPAASNTDLYNDTAAPYLPLHRLDPIF